MFLNLSEFLSEKSENLCVLDSCHMFAECSEKSVLLFKKNLRCVLNSDHIFHIFLIMKTNLAVSIVFLNLPSCFKGRPQHNQNVSDCLC